ncbi:MAG: hypothetical protein WCE90_12480 [Candidatus Zixiibacteriota bacterium]
MKTKAVSSIGLMVVAVSILLCANCLAGVPQLINYQGVLKDSLGVPVTGDPGMEFSIWDDSIGGNRTWNETYVAVHVQNGLFNVLLGSKNPIPDSVFNATNRWLQVQVSISVLSPRRRIVSVGYANKAANADTASYATNSDMVDGKHANELGIAPSKVYDSGWFLANVNTTYEKTHNLGTTKVILQLWGSDTNDGSGTVAHYVIGMHYDQANARRGTNIVKLTPTTIKVRGKNFR